MWANKRHITDCQGNERRVWQMKTRLSVCFGWGLFTNEHIRGDPNLFFPSLSSTSTTTNLVSLRISLNTVLRFRLLFLGLEFSCQQSLWSRVPKSFFTTFRLLHKSYFLRVLQHKFLTRCPKRRRDNGKRPKNKNYAKRKFVLAGKWNR